jgi:KUP system potassium uptake protein
VRHGRRVLILIGLFGTALLYGDGMITPAISVLSAVEGIDVATPVLRPFIIPIAIGILIGLFMIQRHGTGKVGSIFGPVMIVWFTTLAVLGLVHIAHTPTVLRALNPVHAIRFIVDNKLTGFLALGSVFLVVTGSEALYADMGHFGKKPIQLAWFGLVLPSLVVNYFGQGALLISDPSAISNPFYLMAPSWALWPLVVLATAATIIASQALISGAFSLTMQAIQLGYLSRMHILHTSETESGQIYIPAINWTLMVACVGLVLGFKSSSGLADAYGVAVATTMVITTMLFFTVTREQWGWPWPAAISISALFLAIDLTYFGANLFKVPTGGWFPLVIGFAVFMVMTTWKRGREILGSRLRQGELSIERFIGSIATHPPTRVPGTAIYLTSRLGATPQALLTNFRHNEVLHETTVVLSISTSDTPRVPQARRARVWDLGDGFFQVLLSYGFMEEPDIPKALFSIVQPGFGVREEHTTYVLGRESVIASELEGMVMWRERLFSLMSRNATNDRDLSTVVGHQSSVGGNHPCRNEQRPAAGLSRGGRR